MFVVLMVAASCLLSPVDAPVSDPFRPPPCPWCPGNRGIEYLTEAGQTVRAVAAGRVTFAGDVAGHTYVTVRLADGRLVTYGRLVEVLVAEGGTVVPRQRLGRAATDFILTVRRAGEYEDPAGLLAGRRLPRLVRLDGGRRPPPSARCLAEPAGRANRWGSAAGLG